MPHDPNILDALTSYLANKTGSGLVGGGEKPKPLNNQGNIAVDKSRIDDTADIRDSIAALVAGNYRRLNNDDPNVKAHIQRILGLLPGKAGQDLLTHIVVQNNNPEFQRLNPTQRLDQFYQINSSNPETNAIIQRAKAFGYGPIAGFKDTQDITNLGLQNNPLIVKK